MVKFFFRDTYTNNEMNKTLARKGTTLSKNMTNTESLTLTDLEADSSTLGYVQSTRVTCNELDIPISAPSDITVGQIYFNAATHKLFISDGTKIADNVTYNWYSVQLTLEP